MIKLTSSNVVKMYQVLNRSSQILEKSLNLSYLDAFVESCQNILDSNHVRIKNGQPGKSAVQKLNQLYSEVDYRKFSSETVRRAIQLTMIKAIREDKIQANHQITPGLIAFIMGYIMVRILKGRQHLKLLDLTVGTGNLLTAVIYQLRRALRCSINATGIDNDETLISIAGVSAEMQRVPVNLIHQDALTNFKPNNYDLAISDLPIGYYPLDQNAAHYQTKASTGHSYAHHLLIEQAMNHVAPGGFGEFLVPSTLFDTQMAKGLLSWMEKNVYLQGILNLPKELFVNARAQKAVLLLQNHGENAHQVHHVMIGEFPSFKRPAEFQKFIAEIVEWEEKDLLRR